MRDLSLIKSLSLIVKIQFQQYSSADSDQRHIIYDEEFIYLTDGTPSYYFGKVTRTP